MRRGPTSSPPSRSTRPKKTTWRTTACCGAAVDGSATCRRDEPSESLVANREQVLVVLEQRPKGRLHVLDVQLLPAESRQRPHPVDRLREPRRLLQVEGAQFRCEPRSLLREPLGHAGHPKLDDLDLPRHRRMVDP